MLRKKQRSFFQNNSCQNQGISCQRWGDVRYFAIMKNNKDVRHDAAKKGGKS